MITFAAHGDLADPDILPLWSALALRFAQGVDPASVKTIRIRLEPSGRAKVAGWLGQAHRGGLRPDSDGYIRVSVPQLLTALGMSATQLYAVVDEIVGVGRDALELREVERERAQLWRYAAHILPDNPRLVAQLRAVGVSRESMGRTRRLLEALARARCLAPLARPVHLARLAQTCAGDPHYFDLNDGGQGARLVQLAVEILQCPAPTTPLEERQALAGIGVLAERLSHTVIAMNINAVGDGPTDRAIRLAKADRRVLNLNLRDLTEFAPQFVPGERWLVVENPSVVEEAIIRAPERAVVCTSGAFTAVDHALLALAQEHGVALVYSGDLDVGGAFAARTAARYGASIQLMDQATAHAARDAGPLTGSPASVPVLPGPSIVATSGQPSADGWTVFQEHPLMLDLLLGDDPSDPLDPRRIAGGAQPRSCGTTPEAPSHFA